MINDAFFLLEEPDKTKEEQTKVSCSERRQIRNPFLKMAEMGYQISSDELVTPQVTNSRAWRQRAQGAGVATIVLLHVAAVAHGTTYQATEAAIEDSESLLAEVDSAQANFQAIGKESHCATLKKRLLGSQVL